MADLKLPYIKLRPQTDGTFRPRFSPGARERELGFVDKDLRHDDNGAWFTLEEARGWISVTMEKIKQARETGRRIKPPKPGKGNTLEDLLDDWTAALRKKLERGEISEAGLESYEKAARAVIYKPEERGAAKDRRAQERAAKLLKLAPPERQREPIATTPVRAIGAPELRMFFDYAREARGHNMALGMIAAISAAWTWGRESADWRLGINPRHGMEFARPDGRISIIELAEFIALVEAADELGFPSIGDNCYLGLFTGQRPTDRLSLEDGGMIEGRRHLRQSKTGVLVKIKDTAMLAERLDKARARVARLKLGKGTRPSTIVVYENTGLAYDATTYRHRFAEVRERAALKVPSVAQRTDQDFRDTFVTMTYRAMVRAGRVDLKAIADVTGHSHQSIETIIKHYLGRDASAADQAIDLLADFVGKEMAG